MNLSKKKANAKHATSPQRAAAGSVEKPASKMRELRDPDPKAPPGYRCGRCGAAKKGHVCPYMFIKNGEVSSETTVQNPGVSDGTEGIYNCKSCGEKKKFHICPFGRVLILLECVPIDPAARSSVSASNGRIIFFLPSLLTTSSDYRLRKRSADLPLTNISSEIWGVFSTTLVW